MNFTNVLTDYVKHNVIVIMNFSNYDQNISVTAKKRIEISQFYFLKFTLILCQAFKTTNFTRRGRNMVVCQKLENQYKK